MQNIMKKTAAGAVIGGSLLFTGMGVAQAAPPQIQDGLVNLAIRRRHCAQTIWTLPSPRRFAAAVCPT